MEQYHDLLKGIITKGDTQYNERTQSSMIASAGDQSVYDLREGFPLVTTKKVFFKGVAEELFWMLRGETKAGALQSRGVGIWNRDAFQNYLKRHGLEEAVPKHSKEWDKRFRDYVKRMKEDPDFSDEETDLGPVYGKQWRGWETRDGRKIDQVAKIIEGIKSKPGSRYHVLSAWNVGELDEMAIGPCHCINQFTVFGDRLDTNAFQRSCDVFLGVPFNIAQYGLLTHLIAKETDLEPGTFIHSYGNVHIYNGVRERAEFLQDPSNFAELKERISQAKSSQDYLDAKEWYERSAEPERPEDETKDHLPKVLHQLSLPPRNRPRIEIADKPLDQIIREPYGENVKITGYDPDTSWDSSAKQAS